jgi:hypothetical protein
MDHGEFDHPTKIHPMSCSKDRGENKISNTINIFGNFILPSPFVPRMGYLPPNKNPPGAPSLMMSMFESIDNFLHTLRANRNISARLLPSLFPPTFHHLLDEYFMIGTGFDTIDGIGFHFEPFFRWTSASSAASVCSPPTQQVRSNIHADRWGERKGTVQLINMILWLQVSDTMGERT